jgi:hypothetical protein
MYTFHILFDNTLLTNLSIYFVKTLVYTAVYLHRHRKAGGHCSAHRSSAPATTEPKFEQQPNGYPAAVPV